MLFLYHACVSNGFLVVLKTAKRNIYMRVLFLCLIVVLLILIIYTVVTSDAYRRAVAQSSEKLSNGTYDKHARKAAQTRRAMHAPAVDDLHAHARLLRFNLLENQLAREDLDAREAVDEMLAMYEQALEGVVFGNAAFGGEAFALVFEVAPLMPAPAAHAHAAAVDAAAEKISRAGNKAAAAINYLQEIQKPVEDLQNVHDSKLNRDLLSALDKIRMTVTRKSNAQTNEDIRAAIARSDLSGSKKEAALKTLREMEKNARIETFHGHENDILSTVWARGGIPNNGDVQGAVLLALADASESGTPVCINGRVSRVVNSLHMIDMDFKHSAAMTTKAYRDQVFHETQKIYARAIAQEPKSPAHAQVFAEYKGASVADDTPEIVAAREEIAAEMTAEILAGVNKYADKFTPEEMEKLRAEVLVVV
jgi:hypothetical protein